ncbi:hypothetical protein NV379_19895 [Paenibacillus sp. N1-5-1-14]|nr:hypothetical protein [Paenibacillus radicibacter]
MVILTTFQLGLFSYFWYTIDNIGFMYYLNIGFRVFILIYLILLIIRMIRQQKEIRITPDKLVVRGTQLEPSSIKRIKIHTVFNTRIGIQPIGKQFIPTKYYFQFKHSEDDAIKALRTWANENQVEVKEGHFLAWW